MVGGWRISRTNRVEFYGARSQELVKADLYKRPEKIRGKIISEMVRLAKSLSLRGYNRQPPGGGSLGIMRTSMKEGSVEISTTGGKPGRGKL